MAIDVLISYHTDSSLQITEAICNNMEANGLRCWYASRDSRGAYAKAIAEAIDECRVFVLVLNREASFSEDVLNEINLAFERLRRGEDLVIIPFKITDEDINKAAKYYIGRMHWIDAVTPPIEERIKELSHIVSEMLQKRQVKNHQFQKTAVLPNYNFIGREEELAHLKDVLDKERILFLQGIGGVGKTELVKQFIYMHGQGYEEIVLMHYEGSLQEMIVSEKYFSMEGIIRKKEEGETDKDYAYRKLDAIQNVTSSKTLVVVDNFDVTEDEFLEAFLEGPYTVLVTTRIDFEGLGMPVLNMGTLKIKEQRELFARNYKRKVLKEEEAYIEEIIRLVDGHTLAIELIAKLMASRRIKPSAMVEQLKEYGISPEMKGNVKHGFKKAESIYSHIQTLFSVEKLVQGEQEVLKNLTLMPISGVSAEEFIKWCQLEDVEHLDELIQRGWVRYDVVKDYIGLHPVISDVVKEECQVRLDSCKVMFENLSKLFSKSWNMEAKKRIELGEIAKAIYHKYPLSDETYFTNYESMLQIFQNLCYYELCEKLLVEMKNIVGEMESERLAWYYYQVADYEINKLNYDVAIENMKKSIGLYERVACNSEKHGYVVKHLAHIYHAYYKHIEERKEYLDLAKECLQESGRIFRICADEISSHMGSQYYAMATNMYYYGCYEEALSYAQKSFDIYMELNGELDPDTTSPMRMQGLTLSKMGRFEEAVSIMRRGLHTRELLWGKEQFRYLDYYETLADIYAEHGEKEKAMEILHEIIERIGDRIQEFAVYLQKIQRKLEKLQED